MGFRDENIEIASSRSLPLSAAKGSFPCTFPRSGLRVVLPAPEHVAHNDHLIAVILSNAKDLLFAAEKADPSLRSG